MGRKTTQRHKTMAEKTPQCHKTHKEQKTPAMSRIEKRAAVNLKHQNKGYKTAAMTNEKRIRRDYSSVVCSWTTITPSGGSNSGW